MGFEPRTKTAAKLFNRLSWVIGIGAGVTIGGFGFTVLAGIEAAFVGGGFDSIEPAYLDWLLVLGTYSTAMALFGLAMAQFLRSAREGS